MQPLAPGAKALVASFGKVTFEWIPREINKHADRLANEAMDEQAGISMAGARPTAPAAWTGAKGTPTRLVLLRHGQTQLSAERRYSGRGNPPLTDIGRGQATAAAERLRGRDIAAVVCSPLTARCRPAGAVVRPRVRRSPRWTS